MGDRPEERVGRAQRARVRARAREERPLIARIRIRLAGTGGFTLIELLVTLLLLSVVMGGIVTAFTSATVNEARNYSRLTNEENARQALNRLRMDIHCAKAANGPSENSQQGWTFVLTEVVNIDTNTPGCPKLGLLTDPGPPAVYSSYVSWCTVKVSDNRWRLFRDNVEDCSDTTKRTFMVDYIIHPDIWDVTDLFCPKPFWQQSVGVNLITNVNPGDPSSHYDLRDVVGLRNSPRADTTLTCGA